MNVMAGKTLYDKLWDAHLIKQNDDGSIDEIMGVRHKELAVEGVQFHPESILTQHGHDLLNNFLKG